MRTTLKYVVGFYMCRSSVFKHIEPRKLSFIRIEVFLDKRMRVWPIPRHAGEVLRDVPQQFELVSRLGPHHLLGGL